VNRDRATQALSLVVIVLIWAGLSASIGSNVIPSPSDIAPFLAKLITTGNFIDPLMQSLVRTGIGFAVGFVAGVAIGIAVAKTRLFDRSTSLLLNIALFAPTLVIIFLGIAMIGTQLLSIAIVTGLVVAPNVAIYMRDVLRDLDPEVLSMADSFRVGGAQRIRDVYLPYLVPPMLSAARIGFSMSWKVVMLAEVFGFPGGLGFQIRINYTVYNLTALLAWLAIFVFALLVIEQLLRLAERRLVRWQPAH
jgi:ABC-type nitrate/sulfonate/bicarbonate transport system permease component